MDYRFQIYSICQLANSSKYEGAFMKINIKLDKDDVLIKKLNERGIMHDPESEYVLSKKADKGRFLSVSFDGKEMFIPISDVMYIESLGHDILVHTSAKVYNSTTRLKQYEADLDQDDFLRISNSVIVSLKCIKRIEVSLFQKFILELTSGDKLDVTRSYYYLFKEKMKI